MLPCSTAVTPARPRRSIISRKMPCAISTFSDSSDRNSSVVSDRTDGSVDGPDGLLGRAAFDDRFEADDVRRRDFSRARRRDARR